MDVQEAFRVSSDPRQLGTHNIGGVCGKDRVFFADAADPFEQLLFHLQLFYDRFNDQAGFFGAGVHIRADDEPAFRFIGLLLRQPSLFYTARQILIRPGSRFFRGSRKAVAEKHPEPCLTSLDRGVHRDLLSHHTRADHGDGLYIFNRHSDPSSSLFTVVQ